MRLTLLVPSTAPAPLAQLAAGPTIVRATGHAQLASELLARAAGAPTVSARGDALLVAIEHAARALGELFDADTARDHLARVAARL